MIFLQVIAVVIAYLLLGVCLTTVFNAYLIAFEDDSLDRSDASFAIFFYPIIIIVLALYLTLTCAESTWNHFLDTLCNVSEWFAGVMFKISSKLAELMKGKKKEP